MNCGNCGTPLVEGSNVCPNCGSLNMPLEHNQAVQEQIQVSNASLSDDNFIELNDDNDEIEQITEFMAPPSLNITGDENLTSGVSDISNVSDVSTYSPEALAEEKENKDQEEIRKKEDIDIQIPSVQKPVEDVNVPNDGTAPVVDEMTLTVGEKTETAPVVDDNGKKKLKLKIKVNKNVPKNLMIIVAVIFLVIGILLGKAFFSKNYCVSAPAINRVTDKTNFVADGKNNTTNIGSYTYKIPTDYIFDKSNGGLLVYDKNDTFRIFIRTDKGNYQDLSGAKNSIRETLKENSVIVNGVKEINITDKNYLVFEGSTKSVNRLIAFADAANGYVYYIEIITNDNSYDYDVLDVAADIALNATYQEKSANMEKIDIYDISDVSIKAAQEYKNLTVNK